MRVFVCFNYKSLFIGVRRRREWRRRPHDARINVFDAICSSVSRFFFSFVSFVGTICCWCMAFLHYRLPSPLPPVPTLIFIQVQQSTDSFPFYSIAECSFTRRRHVFVFFVLFLFLSVLFFCVSLLCSPSSILLLFGICLA